MDDLTGCSLPQGIELQMVKIKPTKMELRSLTGMALY